MEDTNTTEEGAGTAEEDAAVEAAATAGTWQLGQCLCDQISLGVWCVRGSSTPGGPIMGTSRPWHTWQICDVLYSPVGMTR